jgi:capsular polysaccharide transport system permease protein
LNYFVYEKAEAHNLLLMMYGYLCAWAIGASVGNFVAELSARYDIFSRIMPVLLRPVFWLSGIFYTANELPLGIAEILTLNPLFQAIEVLRSGAFQGYESRSVVYSQPILFVVIMVLSAELFKRIKKS